MGKLYGTTVIGKVKRILVPYFFFSVLYIPLRYFAAGLSNSTYSTPIWQILIGNSPNGGVWFLYALFLYYLVAMVFINKNNIEPVILVSVVLYYIGRQGFLPGDWNNFISNLIWFVIGLYVAKQKNKYGAISFRINSYKDLCFRIVLFIGTVVLMEKYGLNLRLVAGITGISVVVFISEHLKDLEILSKLGMYSMHIYLLHGPIQVVVRSVLGKMSVPIWSVPVLLFATGLFGSYVLGVLILDRIKIFRVVLFGGVA